MSRGDFGWACQGVVVQSGDERKVGWRARSAWPICVSRGLVRGVSEFEGVGVTHGMGAVYPREEVMGREGLERVRPAALDTVPIMRFCLPRRRIREGRGAVL